MIKNGQYKLVTLDVDGTLIDETGIIRPRVKTAIRQAQDMGVTVNLCTGRLATTCQHFVEELQLDCYHIFYSGALLKNLLSGHILTKHPIAPDVAQNIVRFARKHALYLEVHTEYAYLYELEDAYSDFQERTLGIHAIQADLLDVVANHEILKLQFVTESPDDLRRIEQYRRSSNHIELSSGKAPGYPTMDFVNVVPAGISKGSGIIELTQAMGITPAQVIAIGDSIGDIEALQVAGLGVAMGNSEEELKHHADYVTASVWEDGVAEVIERFILNP